MICINYGYVKIIAKNTEPIESNQKKPTLLKKMSLPENFIDKKRGNFGVILFEWK